MEPTDRVLRIAVVGTGAAGLTAAWLLARRHEVTVFEKNDYAGGHVHTVVLDSGPDAGTPVDTGFIVMNHRTYPVLTRLLAVLGVSLRDSDMSFGYHDELTGLQYCGSGLNTLFAQRRNLFRPSFHGMIRDILRFNREAPQDLAAGKLAGLSLGEYLDRGGYGRAFVDDYILPMGAAIWSPPRQKMLAFPADNFIGFFANHGLLSVSDRPQWRTVAGGSHTYVRRILAALPRPVRLGTPVTGIRRDGPQVLVRHGEEQEPFDRVVVAAHADEALRLLEDPTGDEQRWLGPWQYEPNRTVLHTDASVLPPLRRARASWNSTREVAGEAAMSLTYDMNRLQGLTTSRQYLVSLNRQREIRPGEVIRELVYTHPTYTPESTATQPHLPALNGIRGTYFCGSYFGHGFHEDAVRSGLEVARCFGLEL